MAAAKLLEREEVSTKTDTAAPTGQPVETDTDDNSLINEELNGVGDGSRTRDFRIHNPALYP